MTDSIFELLLSPTTMLEGELQLLSGGADSLPALESLLKGEAKNRFGVPYVQLGLPLQCALEVAGRLGPVAKPLEPLLREQLRHGNHTAAMALRSLGSLEPDSIFQLAASLEGDLLLATESATALLANGEAEHPAVLEVAARSKSAAQMLELARRYHNRVRPRTDPDVPPSERSRGSR